MPAITRQLRSPQLVGHANRLHNLHVPCILSTVVRVTRTSNPGFYLVTLCQFNPLPVLLCDCHASIAVIVSLKRHGFNAIWFNTWSRTRRAWRDFLCTSECNYSSIDGVTDSLPTRRTASFLQPCHACTHHHASHTHSVQNAMNALGFSLADYFSLTGQEVMSQCL